MNWWKDLKGEIRLSEPLKNHTTFRIGGPAKYFIEPKDISDLKLLLRLAKRYKISIAVIGAGSNILVSDKGINGIVLRLNAPCFKKIIFRNNYLEANGGLLLSQLAHLAQKYGLSGAEFLAGIPGTVAGALVMNAGVHQKSISDLVQDVTVMDYNGKIKKLHRKDIKFNYRSCNLAKYIILSTRLKLFKKNKTEIKNRIKKYLNYRKRTQDLSRPSAGCIFKNPQRCLAGQLIDLCGLKGKKIGNAMISRKHANFILNLGRGRASDILKLMNLVKRKVRNKFNITLEPEIKIWR